MTNRNDNRERRGKYPKKNDAEFDNELTIRSEVTKKDLRKKKK
jgi:hypothetical protein